MNCLQIESILSHIIGETKTIFRKCLAESELLSIDKLIKIGKDNIFIILTGGSAEIGHFYLIYIDSKKRLTIFDSLAKQKIPQKLICLLKINCVTFNTQCIQGAHSCVCGLYCLYVAVLLARGYNLKQILLHFSRSDFNWNDQCIFAWFKRYFGHICRLTHKELMDCDFSS